LSKKTSSLELELQSRNPSLKFSNVKPLKRRMKPGERSFLADKLEKDFRSYIEIQKNGLASKIFL